MFPPQADSAKEQEELAPLSDTVTELTRDAAERLRQANAEEERVVEDLQEAKQALEEQRRAPNPYAKLGSQVVKPTASSRRRAERAFKEVAEKTLEPEKPLSLLEAYQEIEELGKVNEETKEALAEHADELEELKRRVAELEKREEDLDYELWEAHGRIEELEEDNEADKVEFAGLLQVAQAELDEAKEHIGSLEEEAERNKDLLEFVKMNKDDLNVHFPGAF